MNKIHSAIKSIFKNNNITENFNFSDPPNKEVGDIAVGCFQFAKEMGKNPTEIAKEIAEKISSKEYESIKKVEAVGPYVNFFLNNQWLAKTIFSEINENYGSHDFGKGHIQMVEFAHPNTHKMFHIGHLRNITTGESIVRILENAGYKIIRANYQGDVGMHIAKSLFGINQLLNEYEAAKNKNLHEQVQFLGKAYALGGQAYENKEEARSEIIEINKKIYSRDKSIQEIYNTTRSWSLEYFDHIYKRVYSNFDRFYFESEVYERGEEIVREFLKSGVFEESQDAVIFPGSKHNLHDRVFITSQGFAGYEAKEMALGELQFFEYNPEKIIHVVGKEQTGYFEVVIKALEFTLPESKGKEEHLNYGWVQLKEGKMSSRTGKVVLGEWLLD